MKPVRSHEDQPSRAHTGKELLAVIPEPSNGNTDRIALVERTKQLIADHAGEVGSYIWGTAVDEAGRPHVEPGFLPAADGLPVAIATAE